MRKLDRTAVERIAKGACFLGSGGGGPLSITPAIIDNIFKHSDHVKVVEVDEVPDEAGVAIVAGMGSPQHSAGITFDTAPAAAFDAVAKASGLHLNYVAAVEVGAANSVIPMLVAAQKGLPLVDANGAGRAVPTLPLTTYARAGVSAAPAVLSAVGVPGNPCEQSPRDASAEAVEDWAQVVLTTNPNFTQYNAGAVSLWAMSGSKLKQQGSQPTAIRGDLVLAEQVGRALEANNPLAAVVDVLQTHQREVKVLGTGRVVAVQERDVGALDGGLVTVVMEHGVLQLPYLNEFLGAFAWDASPPRYLLGPDMICCLTPDGEALSNPAINDRFKQQGAFDMSVVAIEADAAIRKPDMFAYFAQHIAALYPGFRGGYEQPASLSMNWTGIARW
ncbi:MAG: DUF917 family protein [Oleiphilaceae bacterium]|nr:DUF917 family protein [Oleiphilaceae bacterium]